MKKKTIIRVLNTINSICLYTNCNLCVFKKTCPYSYVQMMNVGNIEHVADVIKNIIDEKEIGQVEE